MRTHRIGADVVAAFDTAATNRRPDGVPYELGIEFRTDNGAQIINWPDQTHGNCGEGNRNARGAEAIRIKTDSVIRCRLRTSLP